VFGARQEFLEGEACKCDRVAVVSCRGTRIQTSTSTQGQGALADFVGDYSGQFTGGLTDACYTPICSRARDLRCAAFFGFPCEAANRSPGKPWPEGWDFCSKRKPDRSRMLAWPRPPLPGRAQDSAVPDPCVAASIVDPMRKVPECGCFQQALGIAGASIR